VASEVINVKLHLLINFARSFFPASVATLDHAADMSSGRRLARSARRASPLCDEAVWRDLARCAGDADRMGQSNLQTSRGPPHPGQI
jgi:hypothetical protein